MDQVVRAATAEEIAAAAAKQKQVQLEGSARRIYPEGFQSEKTIKLLVPIEFDGVLYEVVTLRRLRGKDLVRSGAGMGDVDFIQIMSGLPAAVIAELDLEDFFAVMEAAEDFLPQALRTDIESTPHASQRSPE